MAIHALEHFLQLLVQLLRRFLIVERVGKLDVSVIGKRDTVFRIGPVFGG